MTKSSSAAGDDKHLARAHEFVKFLERADFVPKVSGGELIGLRNALVEEFSAVEREAIRSCDADFEKAESLLDAERDKVRRLREALQEIVTANAALYGPGVSGNDFTERFEQAINAAYSVLTVEPTARPEGACWACGGETHPHDSSFCDSPGCRACEDTRCAATDCGRLPRSPTDSSLKAEAERDAARDAVVVLSRRLKQFADAGSCGCVPGHHADACGLDVLLANTATLAAQRRAETWREGWIAGRDAAVVRVGEWSPPQETDIDDVADLADDIGTLEPPTTGGGEP